ncbi:MAG: ComF family protein [Ignavibacteriae bacterium]|nr:ComF family protein [Ignavibacteriota bacterium]MCB9216966.1 ComF family protein [Ignavibacteria bacterium]
MNSYLTTLGGDLLHLIAPSLCPSCDEPIPTTLRGICETCRATLTTAPYPDEMFEGLLKHHHPDELALDAIGSLFTFEQDSPVQKIIHAIKYRGCRSLGRAMGEELGLALMAFQEFSEIDLILPVPLHKAKLRVRGYNQGEEIGIGFANAWKIPLIHFGLKRRRHTQSQTTLSAKQRLLNVSDAFAVTTTEVAGARVLLTDDVFTTGATLNACASALLTAGAHSVVAATVAWDEVSRDNHSTADWEFNF